MLDAIDQTLISALMQDSRRSLKALAQISGLSAPSVSERLRRLEERGVISAYTLEIDPRFLGYQLQAIVRIRPLPGKLQEVERQILRLPSSPNATRSPATTASLPVSRCAPWNNWTACWTTSITTPKPTPRLSRNRRSNGACRLWNEPHPESAFRIEKRQKRSRKAPLRAQSRGVSHYKSATHPTYLQDIS